MFYTEIDGDANNALVSASRKSAVAKGRPEKAKGHEVRIFLENRGVRMPDAEGNRMLLNVRASSNGKYTPNVSLHNALEKLSILSHNAAQIVLKRAISGELASGLYEACQEVEGLLSE